MVEKVEKGARTLKRRLLDDDEKNAPAIVEGLKFMNKIDPELIRSIPLARGVLHDALRKEQRRAAQKSKRINVFALEDDE